MIYKNMTNVSMAELIGTIIREKNPESSDTLKSLEYLINTNKFVLELETEELTDIKGISQIKASQLIAAIELGKRIITKPKETKININSPKEVYALFHDMRFLNKEYFKVLLLNTKNEIIMVDDVSVGNLNSAVVHPREVFSRAIRVCASSMILVHNHPSGNPQPSREDIDLTERLIEAGNILGISVIDHLVVGDGIFLSMKEKLLI